MESDDVKSPPPDIIRVDFERLATVPGLFTDEAERVAAALSAIDAHTPLVRAGWEGPAADTFFAAMDSDIRPALARTVSALRLTADVTALMLRILDQAEQDAARIDWSGGGVVGAASAGAAVVAPARDEGRHGSGGGNGKFVGDAQSALPNPAADIDASAPVAAPSEGTEAPSPQLEVVDQAGPFTVYRDPQTGLHVFQVDLNAIQEYGYTENDLVAYLTELGFADRIGAIVTQMHGWNSGNLTPEQFAREALGTQQALLDEWPLALVGDISDPSSAMVLSLVWNSTGDLPSDIDWNPSRDGRRRDEQLEMGGAMAKFFNALDRANPDSPVVAIFHSESSAAADHMLLQQSQSGGTPIRAGAIDVAIIMQSNAPDPPDTTLGALGSPNRATISGYVNYWQRRGMDIVETAPMTNVHFVVDEWDLALFASASIEGQPRQGQNTRAPESLITAREARTPGSGYATVSIDTLNSSQNSGHGMMNASIDEAVREQYIGAFEQYGIEVHQTD